MVHNIENDKVLVLDKVNKEGWGGITFPGGHVEDGESLIESTIREVWEETGLDIYDLKPAGLINWYNTENHERWLIFLYKTSSFDGDLIESSHEGQVSWMLMKDLGRVELASDMGHYLKLFLNDDVNEAYAEWSDSHITEFDYF